MVVWTDSHHLFGVTSEYYLDAKDSGRTSYVQPIKLDDVIALAYRRNGQVL